MKRKVVLSVPPPPVFCIFPLHSAAFCATFWTPGTSLSSPMAGFFSVTDRVLSFRALIPTLRRTPPPVIHKVLPRFITCFFILSACVNFFSGYLSHVHKDGNSLIVLYCHEKLDPPALLRKFSFLTWACVQTSPISHFTHYKGSNRRLHAGYVHFVYAS